MVKTISRSAPTSEVKAELLQVARALRKMRRRNASDSSEKPFRFQLTIDGKAISTGKDADTENAQREMERVEIVISPEVLERITRVIADAATEGVLATQSARDELTTQQAAELLGVSRPYLIKLIDANKIPCRYVGRFRRIRRADLERYERDEQARREAGLNELAAYTQEIGLEY